MNKTELAWAAGFIEGEGSVHFYLRKKHERYPNYAEPHITADNSVKEYIEILQRLLGGSIFMTKNKGKKIGKYETKHDLWRWHVTNLAAYRACKRLLPYLHGKNRANAELVIKFYENRPPRERDEKGRFLPRGPISWI